MALLGLICLGGTLRAQKAHVREAPRADMPAQVDSNSPAYWQDGQLHLLNSTGAGPVRSSGPDQLHLGSPQNITIYGRVNPWPIWFEALWKDAKSGIIFAWYHQEHFGLCPGSNLSVPQIGAAVSFDGGNSFQDQGAIIASGDPVDCSAQNGYFAGGSGDPSVMLDKKHEYFYIFFGHYSGPLEEQGVAVARVPFLARFGQHGQAMKYYQGAWNEPGVGGHTTPLFPAKASWLSAHPDAFWGPSIHWNTYLSQYVILLNHSCCDAGFPGTGVYVTFGGSDLSDLTKWTKPKKIFYDGGWYPQVIGEDPDGTDSRAGRVARLYVYGTSFREIVFEKETPADSTADPPSQ